MIIASVIAILLLIVGVTLPLFMPARATLVAELSGENFSALGKILTAGVRLDLDQRDRTKSLTTDFLSEDGVFAFFDLTSMQAGSHTASSSVTLQPAAKKLLLLGREKVNPPGSKDATIKYCERYDGSKYTLLWSDNAISLVEVLCTTVT